MRLIDSVSLSLRLKDLVGPVTRVQKKKKKIPPDSTPKATPPHTAGYHGIFCPILAKFPLPYP